MSGDMTPRERFLRAAAGKEVDRPPVWLMRQAGRYLPEYRDVRGFLSFEERVSRPEIATELTLQPLRRFPLDAAIVFSDILVPLHGMGRPARFPGEGGPVVDNPVRTPEDVDALRVADPAKDSPYVAQTLGLVRVHVPDHALLGFAGAPFTLAAYLIEGGGSKGFQQTKRFCYHHPQAWDKLLDLCARTAIQHLKAQIRAGCDAVQLFDTWAEQLAPEEYERLVLPHVRKVFDGLRDEGVPLIYFARGTPHLLPHLPKTGATMWSVDWRTPLEEVRAKHPGVPLQGNLDPTLLFAPRETLVQETQWMLEALGGHAHVANLGHGILPGTPVEGVQAFIETVVQWRPRK